MDSLEKSVQKETRCVFEPWSVSIGMRPLAGSLEKGKLDMQILSFSYKSINIVDFGNNIYLARAAYYWECASVLEMAAFRLVWRHQRKACWSIWQDRLVAGETRGKRCPRECIGMPQAQIFLSQMFFPYQKYDPRRFCYSITKRSTEYSHLSRRDV